MWGWNALQTPRTPPHWPDAPSAHSDVTLPSLYIWTCVLFNRENCLTHTWPEYTAHSSLGELHAGAGISNMVIRMASVLLLGVVLYMRRGARWLDAYGILRSAGLLYLGQTAGDVAPHGERAKQHEIQKVDLKFSLLFFLMVVVLFEPLCFSQAQ